jgi:hypothetical protein
MLSYIIFSRFNIINQIYINRYDYGYTKHYIKFEYITGFSIILAILNNYISTNNILSYINYDLIISYILSIYYGYNIYYNKKDIIITDLQQEIKRLNDIINNIDNITTVSENIIYNDGNTDYDIDTDYDINTPDDNSPSNISSPDDIIFIKNT